jgi:hypothetical protein
VCIGTGGRDNKLSLKRKSGSVPGFCEFADLLIGTASSRVRSLESPTRLLYQRPISASQDGGEFSRQAAFLGSFAKKF